jgi:hypothetical protein
LSTLTWYKQSEDKAKFLVTINTVVVGVVNGLVFVNGSKTQGVAGLLVGRVGILLFALGISLLLSFACVLRAVWARHHVLDKSRPNVERLWFFGDIAGMSHAQHANAIADLTDDNFPKHLEAMLVSQSHIFATNVWHKHQALNWAIVFTIIAVGLLFVLGVGYASVLSE